MFICNTRPLKSHAVAPGWQHRLPRSALHQWIRTASRESADKYARGHKGSAGHERRRPTRNSPRPTRRSSVRRRVDRKAPLPCSPRKAGRATSSTRYASEPKGGSRDWRRVPARAWLIHACSGHVGVATAPHGEQNLWAGCRPVRDWPLFVTPEGSGCGPGATGRSHLVWAIALPASCGGAGSARA
jgi:hypothetical protein